MGRENRPALGVARYLAIGLIATVAWAGCTAVLGIDKNYRLEDDGGSSGVLRRELGVQPPGDIRNCLAALSTEEPLLTRLFQYRFSSGTGLEGHSFGNLSLSALTAITGNLETAITASSRVLAV